MEANDLIGGVLRKIFSEPAEAVAYSEAPTDYLVAEGLGDIDLNGLDMGETVTNVANELSLDNSVTETLIQVSEPVPAYGPGAASSAGGGGSAAAAASGGGGGSAAAAAAAAPAAPAAAAAAAAPAPVTSLQQVEQVVTNYTATVYEGDETIESNLFDNSQNLELDFEDVEGHIDEIDIDMEAVNANGDGAVAAGDDIEHSNIASGEGAVAFDGGNRGVVNTGENSGIIADGPVEDAIIGDNNTQVSGSDATVVSGDGNTVNQVDGSGNVVQSGDDNSNLQITGPDATVIDSAGGDVTNTDIDASGHAEVNAVTGDNNATVQGSDNNAGFGSGDVADFGSNNSFGDAQIGFGGSANQENDTIITDNSTTQQDVNNVDTEIVTVIDESTNDSGNLGIDTDIETTIEESFDNEATDSFNSADDFSTDQVAIAEAGDGGVELDDVID